MGIMGIAKKDLLYKSAFVAQAKRKIEKISAMKKDLF